MILGPIETNEFFNPFVRQVANALAALLYLICFYFA